MKYTQFQKSLKKKIEPLYVITGQENFLKQEMIQTLKNHLGEENIFFKEYQGDNQFDLKRFRSDIYSEPLFEDWNLIILKNAGTVLNSLGETIEKYLENPPSETILVIELNKLDQRLRFSKLIKKKGEIIECNLPKKYSRGAGDQMVTWIQKRAKHYKKTIGYEASLALQQLSGGNLDDLDMQIQKLSTFVQNRKEIASDDIHRLVGNNTRTNIFDLLDNVFQRNVRQALLLCKDLFEKGSLSQDGQVVSTAAGISLQLLRLFHYRIKQLWKFSVSHDVAKIPPFIKWKLQKEAAHFDARKLIALWEKLLETEFSLKSSRISPQLVIEQLIIFTCE